MNGSTALFVVHDCLRTMVSGIERDRREYVGKTRRTSRPRRFLWIESRTTLLPELVGET